MKTKILDAHALFREEKMVLNYRPSTIQWWHSAIKQLLRAYPDGELVYVHDLTVPRLRSYLYGMRVQGWTATTFSAQYRALKAFASWCVKRGLLETNPLDAIEKPRLEKRLPKRISTDNAVRLMEAAFHGRATSRFQRYRDRALLGVMLHAGLRAAEVRNLKLGDADLEAGVLRVDEGKGAKDRVVPMSPRLRMYLREYLVERRRLGKNSIFFFTPVGYDKQISKTGFQRIIGRLRKRSGVHFSAHMLRHTFANLMLEGGCDIHAVSKLMGHSDIRTTTVYLWTSGAGLKSAVAKHPLG